MNENPYVKDVAHTGAAGMSGFMLGALVGAGVALLFAPAPGTETRRRVGQTVKRIGNAARDRFEEGKHEIEERLDRGRQGFESGSFGGGTTTGQGRTGTGGTTTGTTTGGGNSGTQGRTPRTGTQGSTYTP